MPVLSATLTEWINPLSTIRCFLNLYYLAFCFIGGIMFLRTFFGGEIMKHNFKHRVFGISLTAFLGLTSLAFIYFLATTKFLTALWIFAVATGLVLLSAGVFFLSFDSRKRLRCVIAAVLALMVFAVEVFGSYYLLVGKFTLEKITEAEAERSEVGVYVRTEDEAQSLQDAKNYIFGILEAQDRTVTDSSLSKISKTLGKTVNTQSYNSIEELMNALIYKKEVYAIVLNKSFLDLFEEIVGHSDDAQKIREIHSVLVETEKIVAAPKTDLSVFTVYISGIDCFGSITRRSRSDVNIIATVNTQTGQVLLVSTPRDFFVPLSISNGIPDKLTHAGIYGIEVSRDTLAMLYDTDIDYYFRVNFDGFQEIVDALGGITVNSEYAFKSGNISFKKGENTLNGKEALAFARNRYSFSSGDRQRGKNQMAVIKGVIDKATGPAIIMNYKTTLDGLAGSFDTNMPYEAITELIQNQVKNGTKWNVVSYSANGTGASRKPYSMNAYAYVMIPDQATVDHAKDLIHRVKNGEAITQE